MRKLLIFLFTTSLMACNGVTSPNFEGKWEQPDNKNIGIMTITKDGNNYLIDTKKGKFIGTLDNEILIINAQGRDIKAMIDEDGKLIIDGKTAVRVEQ